MRIKNTILILAISASILVTGCTTDSKVYHDRISGQNFAINYFKALSNKEDTVVSPLLAIATIGELSGIVNDSVSDKCIALVNDDYEKTELSIHCGELISALEIDEDNIDKDNIDKNNNDTTPNSNFKYSSDLVISLSEQEELYGFSSAYVSNLKNLYRGRVRSYNNIEKYNSIIADINKSRSTEDKVQWHSFDEEGLSVFNSIEYHTNYQDYIKFEPDEQFESNSEYNIEYKSIATSSIKHSLESENTLSCEIATNSDAISLILMMPSDKNESLDDYISSLTTNEIDIILNNNWNKPWCDNSDSEEIYCVFPEILNNSEIRDNSTYNKLGLRELFNDSLEIPGITDDVMLENIINYTDIEIKATNNNNTKNVYKNFSLDKTMVFNRPFLYILIENNSGYPLIIGRVDNIQGGINKWV